MKLIISILIAGFFALFGLLKFEGYFEIGHIDLIKIDGTFETDLSFIKHTTDYIFYIPELIFNSGKDSIKEYFSKYTSLNNKEILISIVFLFHFVFAFTLIQFLRIFPGYTDKKYFTIGIITTYLMLIYFIRYSINF